MDKNYLPLFRKYRPQSFKDVVGQENLVKALTNAIQLDRIANAYLFCGPRGTGKTSCARIFAKSLNCTEGPTVEPCQKCPSCIDITNANGLDVIEIDAASNRGIQDAKELINKVQYAPINGKYKIFIIDEVHMLSNDAFNALLKTFEEPPKNVIFILATTEPHKVLETIVSRCQRFDLRRITTDDIITRLREISDLENIKITDDALFTIAKNVSGGLRDSLALLDQVSILGVKEEITSNLINELLGKINFDTLLNLLNNIYSQDIEKTIKDIDEIYSKGNEPRNLAENFLEFLRHSIVVLSAADTSEISNFTTLIKDNIKKIKAKNFDKDKVIKILNIMVEYYKEIKVSTSPYLWMELASIACCKLDLAAVEISQNKIQVQNTSNIASRVDIVKPEIKPQPIPASKAEDVPKIQQQEKPVAQAQTASETIKEPKPAENPAPASISGNVDSAEIWLNITDKIQSLPARAFYTGVAKLIGISNNTIKLGFLHENALAQAKSEAKMSQLNQAIQTVSPNLEVAFQKITPDTKVIEIKHPKPAFQAPPAFQAQYQNQSKLKPKEPAKTESNSEQGEQETDEPKKPEKKHYSEEVQSMVEQFAGKIIED